MYVKHIEFNIYPIHLQNDQSLALQILWQICELTSNVRNTHLTHKSCLEQILSNERKLLFCQQSQVQLFGKGRRHSIDGYSRCQKNHQILKRSTQLVFNK